MRLVSKEYLCPRPSRAVPQGGVLRHERLPLGLISFDQTFLGTFQHESQPVEVVQATPAAQADAETLRDELMNRPPVPVGQADARYGGQLLHRCTQRRLLRLAEGRGTPGPLENQGPGTTIPEGGGPPTDGMGPMVWEFRSKVSAVAVAVQPWERIPMACHRSQGVGARIIRLCKSLASIRHCSRNRPVSLAPITIPSLTLGQTNPGPGNPRPARKSPL